MGAFVLLRRGSAVDADGVAALFCKRGFSRPIQHVVGHRELWLFPKYLDTKAQVASKDGMMVAVVGTAIYGGRSACAAAPALLADLRSGKLDLRKLAGAYVVLILDRGLIRIVVDPLGQQNIYYSEDGSIVSSSFLAVIHATRRKRRWNRAALLELLSTGALVGPETLVEGVLRLEPGTSPRWDGVTVERPTLPELTQPRAGREMLLKRQLNVLEDLMRRLEATVEETGLESGITGGLDSRLLMGLLRRRLKNVSFHTHPRREPCRELLVAEQLCREIGVPLRIVPVRHTLDMSETELERTLDRSFLFLDGHPRLHASFLEEYQTRNYREEVLGPRRMCASGIGGEIYRNDERMLRPWWRIRSWIRERLVRGSFGRVISRSDEEDLVVGSLMRKTVHRASLRSGERLRRADLKKFYVRVHVPACLGVRQNSEGALAHFISPFVEPMVAEAALPAAAFLGGGFSFQLDMIRTLNPELARVPLDYGFSFENGEPLRNVLKTWLLEFTPRALRRWRRERLLSRDSGYMDELVARFEIVRSLRDAMRALPLPIDWGQLERRHDGAQLMLSVGYLMRKLSDKVAGISDG